MKMSKGTMKNKKGGWGGQHKGVAGELAKAETKRKKWRKQRKKMKEKKG